MFRLRTLGGLQLERGDSPLDAVESQRKALALLAVLAVHGSVGRERLLALLWPESTSSRARGSLKQLVHVLRKQLSAPDLLEGTAELRLNADWIGSDVQDFLLALREGRPAEAVEQYGGPFLDGVHIEAGAEFERWVDGWRSELETLHRDALETLAMEASARGDAVGAVGWWRRRQGADPLNGRVALRLMEALEAAGERSGALQHARVHELLLQEELGLPVDPAVKALAERLRKEPEVVVAPAPPDSTPPASAPAPALPPSPEPGPAVAPPPAPPPAARASTPTTPASPPAAPPRRSRGVLLVALVAVVVLVGLGVTALLRPGGDRADRADLGSRADTPLGAPASLAVLPFVDLSEGGDQEYLADGITEELLLLLSGVPDLRVPARSSSFYFKGKDLPVREIAGQLGVDALVIGTLRSSGQRLRITTQLVDGREDRHLWSEAFDLEADDLFDAPVLIAHQVARALSVQLAFPGGHASSGNGPPGLAAAPDPRAHDAYLRGLFHWNRRSAPDLELALRFFEEATRLDPDYARAWAGLTLVYAVLPINFTPLLSVDEAWERLEAAAARALALDPKLAEVHAARGLALHFAWRWDEAEAAFRRALELDPSHPTVHQWYGEHLAKLGRGDEGVASVRQAIALDPLSLVAHNDLGLVLMISNRLPEAAAQWEATVRMDPAFLLPHFFLHRVHLMTGELEAAAAAGRRWAELTGTAPVDEILALTRAVGDASLRPEALEILEKWAREPRPRYHDIAFYLVLLDEADAALRTLERGVEARHPMMAQLIAAPWVAPLRGDPRLDALLAVVLRDGRGERQEDTPPSG